MWQPIQQFLYDESGPTAVEYAVMLVLIAVACFVSIYAVGNTNSGIWSNNGSQIQAGVS